jgi:hypothetical protein
MSMSPLSRALAKVRLSLCITLLQLISTFIASQFTKQKKNKEIRRKEKYFGEENVDRKFKEGLKVKIRRDYNYFQWYITV